MSESKLKYCDESEDNSAEDVLSESKLKYCDESEDNSAEDDAKMMIERKRSLKGEAVRRLFRSRSSGLMII